MENQVVRFLIKYAHYLVAVMDHWCQEMIREIKARPIPITGIASLQIQSVPNDTLYDEDSFDAYIPAHSVVKIDGDGYVITCENISDYDKSIVMSMTHRNKILRWQAPPPTYDEGEENA